MQEGGQLQPFCLGYNKCLLAMPEHHQPLLTTCRQLGCYRKDASFLGSEVAILPQGWTTAFHGNDKTAQMRDEARE